MPRRVLVIFAAGGALVAGAAALVFLARPASGPAAPAPEAPVAAPAPNRSGSPVPGPPRSGGSTSVPASRPAADAPPREPAPTTGTLRIVSDVPDTSVFIDRVYLGTAPVTAHDVAPGTHTLLLSATGYEAISETIDVLPGERDIAVSFKTIRLDASVAVVHKHTFGSCRGTLRATPDGLTYDTTNRDDAFTVALKSIETFEVDYLNNNLRVTVRNGKTYNFADPDGNADRIFVFHRDVEKARQRLIAEGKGGASSVRYGKRSAAIPPFICTTMCCLPSCM